MCDIPKFDRNDYTKIDCRTICLNAPLARTIKKGKIILCNTQEELTKDAPAGAWLLEIKPDTVEELLTEKLQ
jgi:hypothetical protein